MNDQQTEFLKLYNEYIGRFRTDPPIARLSPQQAVDALRKALETGRPLAPPPRRDGD